MVDFEQIVTKNFSTVLVFAEQDIKKREKSNVKKCFFTFKIQQFYGRRGRHMAVGGRKSAFGEGIVYLGYVLAFLFEKGVSVYLGTDTTISQFMHLIEFRSAKQLNNIIFW